MKPRAVVFDAYGTLFDVHSAVLRDGHGITGDLRALSELWRQRQLEYTWLRSLMERYEDFRILTEAALRSAVGQLRLQASEFQHQRHFRAKAWACIRTGALMGPIAAVPLWLRLRRGAILSPIMTGAATGLLAGLVGTTALEIHCPNLDASHILVSHLGVAVLGAVAGLVVGWAVENRKLIRRP
jgi:hypothetical protein